MASSQRMSTASMRPCVAAVSLLFAVRLLSSAAFFSGSGVRKTPMADSSLRARRSMVALRAEGDVAVADRVSLKVMTPEGNSMTESVSEVVLPSASGQLGVLANHAPMMTALDVGVLRFKQDGKWKPLVVMGGFASVDNNVLSILVNDVETTDDIDLDAAKAELEKATSQLETAETKKDKLDATQTAKKASARVQAAMFGQKKK
eukprot:CAMPEP_0117533390 /NCGR_PEP_ID=MMETSP0784-20121206/39864_1 /TAXON_ID=39447 /ORGANISM="" /LENGTH=203 /DNA_ID=CAMNT_0005329823 /DNA_START=75 /DNA_END=686 /DNA_ORIENTATION=-